MEKPKTLKRTANRPRVERGARKKASPPMVQFSVPYEAIKQAVMLAIFVVGILLVYERDPHRIADVLITVVKRIL